MRTNLATNPAMVATSGLIAARTNLNINPRGVNSFTEYSSVVNQTITPNVTISDHPEGFTTANRVTYTTGSNCGVMLLTPTESGVTYHVQAWVYHETLPTGGTQNFAQAGVQASPAFSFVQGVWKKFTWTYTTSGTAGIGFRVSGQSAGGSFLITGVSVVKSLTAVPYFDALTTTTNRALNPSMEAAGSTTTVRTNYCPNPRPTSTTGFASAAPSHTTFSNGIPAHQSSANGVTTPYIFSPRCTIAVTSGEVFTLSALVEFSSDIKSVDIRAHRRSNNEYFSSGQTISHDPTGLGVHRVSVVFTAPSNIAIDDLDFSIVYYAAGRTVPASGQWARMGEILIEKVGVLMPYFDGSTVRTNLAQNPSVEVNSNGWNNNDGTRYTNARSTTLPLTGTASYMVTRNAASLDSGSSSLWVNGTSSTLTALKVAPGDTLSFSVDVKVENTNRKITTYVAFRNAAGTVLLNTPSTVTNLTNGVTTRVSDIVTAPANTDSVIWVLMTQTQDGSNAVTGERTWYDSLLIEKSAVLLPFIETTSSTIGDFTHSWTGTADSSASIQQAATVDSWTNRWYGSTGGAGVAWRSSGTGMNGGMSFRKLWTKANTGTAQDTGINVIGNVVEGATYTASIYQKSSVDQYITPYIQWLDSGGATLSETAKTASTFTPANVWTRGSVTATAPAGAVSARFVFGPWANATAMPAGATIDYDWAMVEESSVLRQYQDGTAAAPGDHTYAWTGTAHASTSQQRMPSLVIKGTLNAAVGQSTEWAASGTQSMRVVATGNSKDSAAAIPLTMVTGKTYTITATCRLEAAQAGTPDVRARRIQIYHSNTSANSASAPNAAGTTTLSVTFTVTDDTQYQDVRLYNGASAGEGDVWWDNLLIEETDVSKPYFDGSSTPAQDMTHVWSGTANASTSLMRVNLPAGMSNSGNRFGIHSTEWAARGTKSIKVTHSLASSATNNDQFVELQNMISGGLQANKTYTISGTCRTAATLTGTLSSSAMKFLLTVNSVNIPITYSKTKTNTPGASRVVGTFTTGADTNISFFRVMGGASYGNGDVWWDELVLEEGITDGSFFDGSGSVNTNLLSNPGFETDTTGWGGAGAPVGTISRVTTEKYVGTASLRVDCSGAATNQGTFINANRPALVSGMTYTASVWVKGEAGKRIHLEIRELTAAFGLIASTSSSIITATGSWERISVSRQMTTGVWGDMVVRNTDAVAHTFYVDAAMFEQSTSASIDWYSGTGDFTYGWTGTADASTSFQRGVVPVSVTAGNISRYVSTVWSVSGNSLRLTPLDVGGSNSTSANLNVTLTAGKTYTAVATRRLAAPLTGTLNSSYAGKMALIQPSLSTLSSSQLPNVAGAATLTWTFTVDPAAVGHTFRLGHGGGPGSGDVWWDNVLIVEGEYAGNYFDGSTPASGDFTYSWTGTANASTSRESAAGPSMVNTSGSAARAHFLSTDRPAGHSKFVRLVNYSSNLAIGFNPTDCVIASNIQRTDLLWVRSSRSINLKLRYRTPDGAGSVDWGSVALTANEWKQVRAFGKPNIGANAALGPIIEATTGFQPGDTLDIGPHMTVEGTYLGEHIDGTKPLSKWDGTADQSTSVGYPPQLLDLAGKPEFDYTSVGIYTLPGGFTNTEPRTLYTVYNNLLDITDQSVYSIVAYGKSDLSDALSNTYLTLRQQQSSNEGNNLLVRRTGGAGALAPFSRTASNNVACWGINPSGYLFISLNNAAVTTDTVTMDVPNEKVSIVTAGPGGSHIRTIMYRGYHDDATRAAISRYLGNKYGALVV
jgi:hypothetical protein